MIKMVLAFLRERKARGKIWMLLKPLETREVGKLGGSPNPAVKYEDEDAGKIRMKAMVHIHPGWAPGDEEPQKDRVKMIARAIKSPKRRPGGTRRWVNGALQQQLAAALAKTPRFCPK